MHAHCQVVWQVKPEVVSWSWTLIQSWVSNTGLEKVVAGIVYPSGSLLIDIFSIHKPLSCSNHVIVLKYLDHLSFLPWHLLSLCFTDRQNSPCLRLRELQKMMNARLKSKLLKELLEGSRILKTPTTCWLLQTCLNTVITGLSFRPLLKDWMYRWYKSN